MKNPWDPIAGILALLFLVALFMPGRQASALTPSTEDRLKREGVEALRDIAGTLKEIGAELRQIRLQMKR